MPSVGVELFRASVRLAHCIMLMWRSLVNQKEQDTGMPPAAPRIRVACIAVREETILLVRHLKDGQSYWMLPGGGVDYRETLVEALVREVREETGLEVRPASLALVNDSIAPGGARHVVNLCFTADIVGGTLSKGVDARVVEAAWVPVEQLDRLPFRPAVGSELKQLIRSGCAGPACYLGNVWQD